MSNKKKPNSATAINDEVFLASPRGQDGASRHITVADEPDLLNLMLRDATTVSELWQPTKYWQNYTRKIETAICRNGLSQLRQQRDILSGYQTAPILGPTLPSSKLKKLIWGLVERTPIVSKVIDGYRNALASSHSVRAGYENGFAILALNLIAKQHPNLTIPAGHIAGYPHDLFLWNEQFVSASWIDYLQRISDFYAAIPQSNVESIVEIGPGLGWSTISHIALNPNLKYCVNIDIPPVLYVSTQFLKSIGEVEVIDYRSTANLEKIVLEPGPDKPRIYQLAPWQVPKIDGTMDFLFNAFSFYEMEKSVCANYIAELKPRLNKGALLHSTTTGKKLPHGPADEISLDFLADNFSERFPNQQDLKFGWNECYGHYSTTVMLLTR